MTNTHGGARKGAGKKPLYGEVMKGRLIKMTDADWAACRALGGASWVRDQIRNSSLPICKMILPL